MSGKRRPVPPVQGGEVGCGHELLRAAHRHVVNGDAERVVHAHGQLGRAMTALELWLFLLDVPDGEQPVGAELVIDGVPRRRFEVRGAYAADGIGEVVLELIIAD